MKPALLFYFLFYVMLGWPAIILVNRIEPLIFGIPCFVFYCYAVGIVGAIGHLIIGMKYLRDPIVPASGQEENA
jgi:hypothetical protein